MSSFVLQAVQQKKTSEDSGGVYYTQVLPTTNETKGTSISELQETSTSTTTTVIAPQDGPRRLHITNLPFKIRDNELKTMFEVCFISRSF